MQLCYVAGIPWVIISIVPTQPMAWIFRASCRIAIFVLLAQASAAQTTSTPDAALLAGLTADFSTLAPQTIRPAQGYIRNAYLIPALYYSQMSD